MVRNILIEIKIFFFLRVLGKKPIIFTCFTRCSSISHSSRRTFTVRFMIEHPTFRTISTRIYNGTRILTLIVNASPLRRTIRIVSTFDHIASDVGIPFQPWRTWARGLVLDPLADGISTARPVIGSADGGAFAQATGVGVGAFIVRLATHYGAFNIGISVIAKLDQKKFSIVEYKFTVKSRFTYLR